MKTPKEFKTKKNNPKSRVKYSELCKTVSRYITENIRKNNRDFLKKVLEDNNGLKSAQRKLCVGRKVIFPLKRVYGTIPKTNNKIVCIVENFYNHLFKCKDQRESTVTDQ